MIKQAAFGTPRQVNFFKNLKVIQIKYSLVHSTTKEILLSQDPKITHVEFGVINILIKCDKFQVNSYRINTNILFYYSSIYKIIIMKLEFSRIFILLITITCLKATCINQLSIKNLPEYNNSYCCKYIMSLFSTSYCVEYQ